MRARTVLEGTKIGDSIAVSGACLTVVELDADGFVVDCMPETLARTTLGRRGPGRSVNLERSLRWGDRLGGHLVLGHVDGVGEVLGVRQAGIAWEVRISLPDELRGAVAAQGLHRHRRHLAHGHPAWTARRFEVGIIPHTLQGDHAAGRQGGDAGEPGGGRAGPVRAAVAAGAGRAQAARPPVGAAGTEAPPRRRPHAKSFYANKGSLDRRIAEHD